MERSVFTFISLLFIVMLLECSCSFVQIVVSSSADAQLLRDGEKAFILGNYQKAEELFLQVYDVDSENQYKNTARYNLACTRMITASNSEEYDSAIALLAEWKKPYQTGFYSENPILVVTALRKSNINLQQQAATLIKEKEAKEKALEKRNREITQLKKKAESLKTLLTSYQEDNISAQEMIETLQHQMTELEAIDQQLQEKKKPL